jgi:hypothetical protein
LLTDGGSPQVSAERKIDVTAAATKVVWVHAYYSVIVTGTGYQEYNKSSKKVNK